MKMGSADDVKPSSDFTATVYLLETRATQPLVKVKVRQTIMAQELVRVVATRARLVHPSQYELAEIFCSRGRQTKERRLAPEEQPYRLIQHWPRGGGQSLVTGAEYRLYLVARETDGNIRSLSWRSAVSGVAAGGRNEGETGDGEDEFLTSFLSQSRDECSDLCALPDLSEDTLLHSLGKRFKAGRIYTYVGSILLAVNPFNFYNIYNPKHQAMYQGGKRRGELPPHIFAIADCAYRAMLDCGKDQCVVISGESGSGKTECCNQVLHHLAHLSKKTGGELTSLEQTLLGAGPVLEAFGNAQTIHNKNSSRFGKFLQVNYRKNGTVHGAIVEKYLLEKSRIISQARGERNYHVFYYLIAGASEEDRRSVCLEGLENYHYLNQGDWSLSQPLEDEKVQFEKLVEDLDCVGFTRETQRKIFHLLAAILHLGNLKFQERRNYHHDEAVSIKNPEVLRTVSTLLGVREETLIESLTSKKTVAGADSVTIHYKYEEAVGTRDAMAKCLYGALFDWIVLQINRSLLNQEDGLHHMGNSIGVLDIFGFEDFYRNSFEQFCINYANEHLQYYFNQHIFQYEQEEYRAEGIDWKHIEFTDNTGCLDLFAKKNVGLFFLLDEERNFPGATNVTLLNKFHNQHRQNVFYEEPMRREDTFSVRHYAGKVKYHVEDFREKNSDHMRPDIVCVLKNSHFAFVRHLLGSHPGQNRRKSSAHRSGSGSPRHQLSRKPRLSDTSLSSYSMSVDGGSVDRSNSGSGGNNSSPKGTFIYKSNHKKRTRRKQSRSKMFRDYKELKMLQNRKIIGASKSKNPSVSLQFQQSLQSLMETLDKAHPYFVRCLRSNTHQAALEFDDETVLRQLRYTGMLATVRLRQSGYNYRVPVEEFVQQYHALLPGGRKSSVDQVQQFLHQIDNEVACNFQIGETKVFLRETLKMLLDEALHHTLMSAIVKIQRFSRALTIKREERTGNQAQEAAVTIQKYVRGYLGRKHYRALQREKGRLPDKQDVRSAGRAVERAQIRRSRLSRQSRTDDEEEASVPPFNNGEGVNTSSPCLLRDDSLFERTLEERLEELSAEGTPERDSNTGSNHSNSESDVQSASEAGLKARCRPHPLPSIPSPSSHSPTPSPQPRSSIAPPDYKKAHCHSPAPLNNLSSFPMQLSLPPEPMSSDSSVASPRGVILEMPQTDIDSLIEKDNDSHNQITNQVTADSMTLGQRSGITNPSTRMEVKGDKPSVPSRHATSASRPSANGENEAIPSGHIEAIPSGHSEAILASNILSPVPEVSSPKTRGIHPLSTENRKVAGRSHSVDDGVLSPLSKDGHMISSGSDEGILIRKELSEEELRIRCGGGEEEERSVSRESGSSGLGLEEVAHQLQGSSQRLEVGKMGLHGGSAPNTPITGRKPKRDAGLSKLDLSPQFQRHSAMRKVVKKSQSTESITVDPRGPDGGSIPASTNSAELGEMKRNSAPHTPVLGVPSHHKREPVLDASLSAPGFDRRTLEKTPSTGTPKTGGADDSPNLIFRIKHAFGKGKGRRGDSDGSDAEEAKEHGSQHKLFSSDGAGLIRRKGSRKKVDKTSSNTSGGSAPSSLVLDHPLGPDTPGADTTRSCSQSSGTGATTGKEWKLLKKSQWHYPDEYRIGTKDELYRMDTFITTRRQIFEEDFGGKRKVSMYDRIFKDALKEFSRMLRARMSTVGSDAKVDIKYRDLMTGFEKMLGKSILQEQLDSNRDSLEDFSETLAVNAFRGYLDEFWKENKEYLKRNKPHKAKRRKHHAKKEALFVKGHKLLPVKSQFSMTTFCEVCNKQMIWNLSEKGLECEYCKFTCHKRCAKLIYVQCRKAQAANSELSNAVYGVSLERLCDGERLVPLVVESLIVAIETKGMYTEGVYRKTGAAGKIQALKAAVNKDLSAVDFHDYPIHVLAQSLKNFFSEMPQPLLTFELYDEFIRAADIDDPKEAAQSLRETTVKLPPANYATLSHLMLHLARIAQNERFNRMSVSSLATVYAPGILRVKHYRSAQETMTLFTKQCRCIDLMLDGNLRKLEASMAEVDELNFDEQAGFTRLSKIRKSIQTQRTKSLEREGSQGGVGGAHALPGNVGSSSTTMGDLSVTSNVIVEVTSTEEVDLMDAQNEEKEISYKLEFIKKKKGLIISNLNNISVHVSSDEDLLSETELELDTESTPEDSATEASTPGSVAPPFPGSSNAATPTGSGPLLLGMPGEEEEEEEDIYLKQRGSVRSPYVRGPSSDEEGGAFFV